MAKDPGGDHLGIVDDQHIGRRKVIHDVGDLPVLDPPRAAMQHHHAGQLAPFGRVLGDELRR